MPEITQSGLYQDDIGQQFLVTQGLSGYTLVDKKKILFRLFLSPFNLARVTAVFARIKYIGEDIPDIEILIPSANLLIENSIPNGPSVGIVFQGNVFPDSSMNYFVEFYLLADRLSFGRFAISELKFQKSGRLQVLVKNLEGIAPWGNKIEANISWLIEIGESLDRFSAMLPVSDGIVLQSNPPPHIGLSWLGGQSIDTWPNPCPSGNRPSEPDDRFPDVLRCPADEMNSFCTVEARELRSQGIRIDVTVAWRPRDYAKFPPPGGEYSGGQAPTVREGDRLATVCGGSRDGKYFTAPIIAQEVGHTFGLEPKDSPHYDGDAHSKDPLLMDPFAFDFRRLKPYFPPPPGTYLGDVMSYAWDQGMDSTLFNAYDWEHLRQKLVEISALAPEDLDESGRKKKLVDEVQTAFIGLQKIKVEDPESNLSSKPGFEWHWTRIGFQRLIEGKPNTNGSGLAPSAESVLFALKELGIKEIYAPTEGKPLSIVINTTAPVRCHNNDIHPSGLP